MIDLDFFPIDERDEIENDELFMRFITDLNYDYDWDSTRDMKWFKWTKEQN